MPEIGGAPLGSRDHVDTWNVTHVARAATSEHTNADANVITTGSPNIYSPSMNEVTGRCNTV